MNFDVGCMYVYYIVYTLYTVTAVYTVYIKIKESILVNSSKLL